jgi:N-hydroxyarylamine O-acetyltransferase
VNVLDHTYRSPASDADQWQIDRLDLEAYLRRVGYHGPLAADERTLAALHRAHVASIPFENLNVMLGRGITVDLPSVEAKLVAARRGGYCYEHGVLFGAVLQRLGFTVDRLLARTGDPLEHPRSRSHLVLRVGAGDRHWLADVGFGNGLLEPLPFVEGEPRRQGAWNYRLVRGEDGAWRLCEEADGAWKTLMTFTEEAQYPVDVEVANYNTATNPHSPFTQRCILARKDDTSVRALRGREFTVERPGQEPEVRRLDDREFAEVLSAEFGSALSPDEVRALVATLPAESGHDA